MMNIAGEARLENSKLDIGNVNVLSSSPVAPAESISAMNHQLLQRVVVALEGDSFDPNRQGMVVEVRQLKTEINRLKFELNEARSEMHRLTIIVRWLWVALAFEPIVIFWLFWLWGK